MKQGKALWDMRRAHLSWDRLCPELASSHFSYPQRILPEAYQCNELRKQPGLFMIKDHFLSPDLLEIIQRLTFEHGGWSIRLQKPELENSFTKSPKRKHPFELSQQNADAMEDAMLTIANRFWSDFHGFLFNQPEKIHFLHTWINCGPLSGFQAGKYHFTHYDCDEYLEFSKGLYRFPPYAAVFYIHIPEVSEGGVTWFPEIRQGVIPKTNRLALFDARLAHSVLPVVASVLKPRIVMVMNLWDYETRDEQFELTNGVLGYTQDRKGELEWLP